MQLIATNTRALKARLEETAKDAHALAHHIGDQALANIVSEVRNRLNEPFMFVIVGEVKAGKSSFINALLNADGREVCKVAPDPCTDTIQQLCYGDAEEVVVLNEYLQQHYLPLPILRDIAIVDTPGTNTIIKHHQAITERFVPSSDLVVFVFEAKNPYRQSAWEFFDFIHRDWYKKVIFVLQQADLMETEDLAINLRGVTQYAAKKGVQSPAVFAVSAKKHLRGDVAASGFDALHAYLQANITGGQAPALKLRNTLTTLHTIAQRAGQAVDLLQTQYEADRAFRADIAQTLDEQAAFSIHQIGLLVENLTHTYRNIADNTEKTLRTGLGMWGVIKRSVQSVFTTKASVKDWLEITFAQLETRLNEELRQKLSNGVGDMAESMQRMVKMIDLKIKNSRTVLQTDDRIFGELTEQRVKVLRELQAEFEELIHARAQFIDAKTLPSDASFSPDLVAGSGIAAIGVVLMAFTQGLVFDITGGVISALGVLFAGVAAGMKRREVLHTYERETMAGCQRLDAEVTEKLRRYVAQLKKQVTDQFADFDALLAMEAQKADTLQQQHRALQIALTTLAANLEQVA